jgi:hypothetical protein
LAPAALASAQGSASTIGRMTSRRRCIVFTPVMVRS